MVHDAGGVSGEGTTILIVVGTGGFTHAAPMLEIGRILAQRGHRIEFATHHGQDRWLSSPSSSNQYDFISKVHLMGPGMDVAAEVEHYMQMQESDARIDYRSYAAPKLRVDAFWEADYAALKEIITTSSSPPSHPSSSSSASPPEERHHRPDLILADFFVDLAARDIQRQFDIPLASMWPQMPYGMLGASYIPGPPGLQIDALTSEHASLWTRVRAALRPLRALPTMVTYLGFLRSMRLRAGVGYMLPFTSKPNHLVLINSFWGLETPRDLPPLAAPVGPVLADQWRNVEGDLKAFLERQKRVLYISFGTHVMVQHRDLDKLLMAMLVLLLPREARVRVLGGGGEHGRSEKGREKWDRGRKAKTGYPEPDRGMVYRESLAHLASLSSSTSTSTSASSSSPENVIDGIVWAMTPAQQNLFHARPADGTTLLLSDADTESNRASLLSSILSNAHPQFHIVPFAPQRGVLAHPSTKLFLTHGGASSVQESIFHGTPMLCLGYFFDQPLNGLRIKEAGIGDALDKASFSAGEVVCKASVVLGADGHVEEGMQVAMNVERMKRIARVASRRKEVAADLCQEVLFDHKYGAAVGSLTTAGVLGNMPDSGTVSEEEDDDEGEQSSAQSVTHNDPLRALEAGQHDHTLASPSPRSNSGSSNKKRQQYYRRKNDGSISKDRTRRPMHLQTADMRMSLWRARNWDLMLLGVTAAAAVGGAGWFAWTRFGGHELYQQIGW